MYVRLCDVDLLGLDPAVLQCFQIPKRMKCPQNIPIALSIISPLIGLPVHVMYTMYRLQMCARVPTLLSTVGGKAKFDREPGWPHRNLVEAAIKQGLRLDLTGAWKGCSRSTYMIQEGIVKDVPVTSEAERHGP